MSEFTRGAICTVFGAILIKSVYEKGRRDGRNAFKKQMTEMVSELESLYEEYKNSKEEVKSEEA